MAPRSIPVVDLKHFTRSKALGKDARAETEAIAQDVCRAFTTWGFAYMINHGIPDDRLLAARQASKKFFELPHAAKRPYARGGDKDNHGWVGLEVENLNPSERPGDYKEAFNAYAYEGERWPDKHVPEFRTSLKEFSDECERLSLDILYLMGVGLQLKDEYLFVNCHRFGQEVTPTTLRSLYYPHSSTGYKENQIRCGEHSDYGSITLLFQDDVGGLQVFDQTQGDYVDATPIEGSVVVNVADLMQRWTSDKLISTKHRVLTPASERQTHESRLSLAFFVHPEDDCLIECIDGSGKYPPVTSRQYLLDKFAETYI